MGANCSCLSYEPWPVLYPGHTDWLPARESQALPDFSFDIVFDRYRLGKDPRRVEEVLRCQFSARTGIRFPRLCRTRSTAWSRLQTRCVPRQHKIRRIVVRSWNAASRLQLRNIDCIGDTARYQWVVECLNAGIGAICPQPAPRPVLRQPAYPPVNPG